MSGPPRHGPLSALRPPDALLALEDGSVFPGHACGAPGEAAGELVFNTAMTGHLEIITDPACRGLLVAFTCPQVGNCGVNSADAESPKPELCGVVVRSICPAPSSRRSRESLPDYLRRHRVVAMEGVDTRALTRRLRSAGAMRAVISTRELDPQRLVEKARAWPGLSGRDLVGEVTPLEATPWLKPAEASGAGARVAEAPAPAAANASAAGAPPGGPPRADPEPIIELEDAEAVEAGADVAALAVLAAIEARHTGQALVLPAVESAARAAGAAEPGAGAVGGLRAAAAGVAAAPGAALRIAILHCGMKAGIAGELQRRGALVRIHPATTPLDRLLADDPDGLVLSSGPGDPGEAREVVELVRAALGRLPIFAIGLGLQLLALALGGRTFKLKSGHRGINQPVLDLTTGRVEITTQNHGYAVDPESLRPAGPADPRAGLVITHLNLNDGTLEGFAHPGLGLLAVQHCPEASPGPRDAAHLFDRFLGAVRARRVGRGSLAAAGGPGDFAPALPAGRG